MVIIKKEEGGVTEVKRNVRILISIVWEGDKHLKMLSKHLWRGWISGQISHYQTTGRDRVDSRHGII